MPQPQDEKELSHFPKKMLGEYYSENDMKELHITEKLILRIYDFDLKMSIKDLDSNFIISNDTIYDMESGEFKIFESGSDSISENIYIIDTLFQISNSNILKKFKGYYFLNIQYESDSWEVKKIEFNRGELTISKVSTQNDLENLKELSESENDDSPYKFKPTKRQFKKFIKQEGFRDKETYKKFQ
ncbi:MAG: hypothetical protein M3Q58_02465 [Bacteroidota bacterium]|nr:hypothetical protein [Bacteroidota bacterium]